MQTSLATELIRQISIYLSRQSECWLEKNFQTESIAERVSLARTKSRDNVEHSDQSLMDLKKSRQDNVKGPGQLRKCPTEGE